MVAVGPSPPMIKSWYSMQQPTEYSNEVDLGYCFLTLFYVFPPKNRFRKKRISVKYLQNFRLLSLSFTRKESFRRKIFHFGAFSNRKLSYFLTNNEHGLCRLRIAGMTFWANVLIGRDHLHAEDEEDENEIIGTRSESLFDRFGP